MKNSLLYLVIATVLLFTYAPLVRAKYGFGDDYGTVLSIDSKVDACLADGRTVYAIAQRFIHEPIQQLSTLGYLRFAGSVGVVLVSLLLYRELRCLPGSPVEHAALAIAIGVLPSLQMYVTQAILWLAIYAGLAAAGAAMMTYRATQCWTAPGALRESSTAGKQDTSSKSMVSHALLSWHVLGRIAGAVGLMLVAANIYQPMLSMYWTVLLLYLLNDHFLISAAYRKRMFVMFFIGLSYFVICFLAFKGFFAFFDASAKERTILTTRPLEKLYWFLRIQLPLGLNFWHLMDSSKRGITLGISAISGLIITAGYVASCRRHLRQANHSEGIPKWRSVLVWRTILLGLVFLLTHVHWLVIEISPQNYRMIVPLGVACLILAYWSMRQLVETFVGTGSRLWVQHAIMIFVAISAVSLCQHYSEKYWIAPHSTAYRYMLMTLRDKIHPDTNRIYLVRQSEADSFVSEWFIESFGRPASDRPWMIEAMVRSAARDAGVADQIKEIDHGSGDEPIPGDDITLILDMRKLALMRLP